jgi:hypothetical protein
VAKGDPKATARMVGSPIPTFATPLIEDTIEIETVDVAAGTYSPEPFGTPYNDIDHGAFPKNLPDHVLVADEPADASGLLRKRTWAAGRTDQDRYNFNLSYEGNSVEHPTYTRSYVFPREGYQPLELLTPDPFDPNAFLIAEQMVSETEPAALRSQFVKVARIYATLPGPITYSIEYPYGGHPSYPRITTKQKHAHMRFPENLSAKCPVENYQSAILIAQSIAQTDYAAVDVVQRIYDIVPRITPPGGTLPDGSITPDTDYGGQEKFGYSVGYMYGKKDFPFITWNLSVPKEGYLPANDLSLCPIEGFETLRLVNQEAKADDKQTQLLSITRRFETLPGPLIHKIDFDNNNPNYPIVSSTQRVAVTEYSPGSPGTDFCAVPSYTNLVLWEQHIAPTDFAVVKEDQRVFETAPGEAIENLDYDSTIDAFVRTTRQKVLLGTIPILDDFTLEFREKPIDKYRSIHIQSKLTALPPTRVEFKTVNNWAFPTLLTGISLTTGVLVANRSEVVWFPNTLRPIQNVPAILRLTTSYHTSPPPAEKIFVLPTRNLVYQGISFQFSISNVLNDEITLTADFTNDTKYGNLTETCTFAATVPSATDYYKIIGFYRTVGCDISIWRARIYVKTVTEVVMV